MRCAFAFDEAKCGVRTLETLRLIEADACAVSLHVRRGDYLLPKHYKTSGCVCGLPYYRNAIAEARRLSPSARFYVFSDDAAWARENIIPLLPGGCSVIDWNAGSSSWQDMLLMSRCRHNVICNSTFSWWGAWLNAHADKVVIAPDTWYAGTPSSIIVPAAWRKVAVK